MNRVELIAAVSAKTEMTKKDSEKALTAFMDVVKDTLVNGDKISIAGFGTFDVVERASRTGRNPKTGESILIESSKAPKFKPSKALKDVVNGR